MMITRCPACRTAFRITQEQLDAREGKVRCGRCTEVFDARESLRAEPASSRPPAPSQSSEPAWRETQVTDAEAPPEHAAAGAVEPELQTVPVAAGALPEPVPKTDRLAARATPELEPQTDHAAGAPTEPDQAGPIAAPESPLPAAIHRRPPPGAPIWFEGTAGSVEKPPTRARGWLAGSALLGLAFAAQLAFFFRGELVLVFPEAKPAVTELCATLGCDVPLPRRAELMSIESSDLQADPSNPGVIMLSATLRNRAPFPQSHPALELTLTDTQDRALARRVFSASDYLGRAVGAETGIPGYSEVAVKVFMQASSVKPTGYRLYLFYP